MDLKNFEAKMRKLLENKSNQLVNDYSNGKPILKLIEKQLMKDWWRIVHIEYDTLSFMRFVEQIKENPNLKNKLKNEIGDVDKFYNALKNCEICIYALYCEIEKINLQNK